MRKAFWGLFGIVLCLAGILSGFVLMENEKNALALDSKKTIFAAIGEETMPFCSWDVKPFERIMAENKSQAIVITVSNPTEKTCSSTLSLRAPGFAISPVKEEQTITLPIKGKGSLSWIISPYRTGTFDITISDILDTRVFGISVNTVFGLSSIQTKFFSILSTLFGPMFTIPWWWEKLRQRKHHIAKQESV